MIKPGAIVFPRDARREFNQLSGSEPTFESFKEFVPNRDRRFGHAYRVMENNPLVITERWIIFKAPKRLQLNVRQTALPADGRPNVDSKWAADHHGHFQLDERLKLRRNGLDSFLP